MNIAKKFLPALFVLLTVLSSTSAWARCGEPAFFECESMTYYPIIFEGTVIKKSHTTVPALSSKTLTIATFKVKKVYKGDIEGQIDIYSDSEGSDEGIFYSEGKTYLVFNKGKDEKAGFYTTSLCAKDFSVSDLDAPYKKRKENEKRNNLYDILGMSKKQAAEIDEGVKKSLKKLHESRKRTLVELDAFKTRVEALDEQIKNNPRAADLLKKREELLKTDSNGSQSKRLMDVCHDAKCVAEKKILENGDNSPVRKSCLEAAAEKYTREAEEHKKSIEKSEVR